MPVDAASPARCKALLEDKKTPCERRVHQRRGRRFCDQHYDQYKEATSAYKRASERVEGLKKAICVLRDNLHTYLATAHIDSAIKVVKRWQDAIVEEMRLREVQHKRFFHLEGASMPWLKRGQILALNELSVEDVGHRIWRQGLAENLVKAEDLIVQLRHQREVVSHSQSHQAVRAPVNTPPRPAVPALASRASMQAARLARERVKLLRHPQARYGVYNAPAGHVDLERQPLADQSHKNSTSEDICLSLVCLVMAVVVVWLLWQAYARWMLYGAKVSLLWLPFFGPTDAAALSSYCFLYSFIWLTLKLCFRTCTVQRVGSPVPVFAMSQLPYSLGVRLAPT
ncbi:hypothetical protein L226DRAFT_271445 [Lentinus tigrinus ALCF2SS1-7]|uniref:uncharacterized protein n=1 Tax=Lentinus tigrinus ALCF2SS1-7 TaxID=1328758 RepID=UPI0011661C4F|nr:hypothetical protein L226DRAFT_271445 [Lentinus tigrinus ALCF2SS1-7]